MPNQNEAGQSGGRVNHAKTDFTNKQQRRISESRKDEEPPAKKRCVWQIPDPHANGTSSPLSSQTPLRIRFTKPRATTQDLTNGTQPNTALKGEIKSRNLSKVIEGEARHTAADHPRPEDERADKRVLRSQDGGARGASELANFFPEFHDVVYGPEIEPEVFNIDSVLYLAEGKSGTSPHKLPIRAHPRPDPHDPLSKHARADSTSSHPASRPNGSTISVLAFQTLDLSQYEEEALQFPTDPLAVEEYIPSHKRGERIERQERNKEKEKARHEKAQLDKLLEELSGPEWPRTMGIPITTDADRKVYESKRIHYLKKVRELLAKFDEWKEKERHLRERKDRAAARAAREEETDEDTDGSNDRGKYSGIHTSPSAQSIDASALQLQQEAGLTTQTKKLKIKLRMSATSNGKVIPQRPFTSFFTKPHERAGALAKHRRGRHVMAFGHPLPDIPEEQGFELPEDIFEQEDQQHWKSARRKRGTGLDL